MIFFYLTKKCSQLHVSSLQNFPPKAPIYQLCISSIVFECRNSNFSKLCKKNFKTAWLRRQRWCFFQNWQKFCLKMGLGHRKHSFSLSPGKHSQALSCKTIHNQQSVRSDWRLFLIDRRSPLKSLSVLYHADHRQGLVGHLVIPPAPIYGRVTCEPNRLSPPLRHLHIGDTIKPPWHHLGTTIPWRHLFDWSSQTCYGISQSVGWLSYVNLSSRRKILKRLYLRAFTTLASPLLTTGDNILPLCYYQKTNMRPKRDTGWLI